MSSQETNGASAPPSPLRLWRTNRDMSLRQAAKILKTTAATLSRIETGENAPSRELERRLIKITKLTRDDLAEPFDLRLDAAPTPQNGAQP